MFKDAAIAEIRERRKMLFKNKYHSSVSELVAAGIKFQQDHPERFANPAKRRKSEILAP
jgi:hypothetical protein